MIKFHYCNVFKNKLESERSKENIERRIQENSKRKDLKNIGNINVFAGGLYVLKVSNPNSRVIIEERNIDIENHTEKVFFVRDLISEQTFDNEYGRILYKKLQNRDWLNSHPLLEEDIQSFKKSYNAYKNNKKERKELPPQNLTSWFDNFSLELNNKIFETEQWVKYALSNNKLDGMLDKYVNTFRLLIEDINNNPYIGKEEKTNLYRHEKYNVGILYSPIEIDNKIYIILHNASHLETQKEHWKNVLKTTQLEFKNTLKSISKLSYRTYPKWTVSDDELWFAIEKSAEMSNLSLTIEQSTFLQNFKFPQYINGQAGSGKSTMLYYLFANVFYFKKADLIDGSIMFLTENENLLSDTKKNVWDLLTNNPEFKLDDMESKEGIDNYFNSFKNFLLGMLTDNDLDKFKKDKYLNFSVFKNLYEGSNLPKHIIRKYSAEEAWFTIITYIYGSIIDKKLSSIDYEDKISRGSKIISLEKFRGIEKNVLPFYEKLIEEYGYWDKLKIIRYINDNINTDFIQKYTVLVCDEAQDFCKVELEFILQQSEYLKYDLSQTSQVPILFAGDPNQTVNPTGFRQDEMTSLLYEELYQKAKFDYDKDTLVYSPSINYRSTHAVVALANFVQYYRMKNLGINNIKPQQAKRPMSNNGSNNFLNFDDIEKDKKLKLNLIKKLQYKVFIVPVDSEDKNVYKIKSNLLSEIEDIELKTSVESKGAEYKQVVLYGFGAYYLDKFGSLDKRLEDEEKFKIGYFFNKLYVGLTRAQTELIIIDSKESKELFWEKLIDKTKVDDAWIIQDDVIIYDSGTINNVLDSTKDDALDNAKQDKKMGEYECNPARLKVSANQFLKLGFPDEANECLALVEEINRNFKGAGTYFLKANNLEKASCSFFKGRHFNDLESIGFNVKSIKQEIRMIVSRIMTGGYLSENDIKTLSHNRAILYEISKDLSWRKDLVTSFIKSETKIDDEKLKKDFVSVLKHIVISKDKDIFLYKEIGRISYELENYDEAVKYWEAIDNYENNKSYFISKLKLAERNHNEQYIVIWLYSLIPFHNEKEKIETFYKILDTHNRVNFETFDNEYFLAIYGAYIGIKDEKNINEFGKIVEEKYQNNLIELENFYRSSLENIDIYVYVIERWAKTIWKINKNNTNQDWLDELNEEDFLESYKKFTLVELQRISEFPNSVKLMPSEHLSNITIKSFRHFGNLELSNLGQFNLILGDNNMGKTSLLEALMFTVDFDTYLKNLIFAYIARNNTTKLLENHQEKYLMPITFIDDFIPKDVTERILEFDLIENRDYWNFKIKRPTKEEIQKELNIDVGIDEEHYIAIITDDSNYEIIELPVFIDKIEPKELIQMQLIPFGKGFDRDLATNYYDNIHKDRKKRKSFLEAMKTFIPKIEEIQVDTNNGDIDIYEDDEYPSALHQYGEGANKLFRILVQITLQEDKKLLIDEIDAGIHYSHFFEFWKIILEVAKEYKVQIFATTHNLECLEHFKNILENESFINYQELSRTITLRELSNGKKKAYTRTFEEFEYELNSKLEIRGGKY